MIAPAANPFQLWEFVAAMAQYSVVAVGFVLVVAVRSAVVVVVRSAAAAP
jgi:hypothetical protein